MAGPSKSVLTPIYLSFWKRSTLRVVPVTIAPTLAARLAQPDQERNGAAAHCFLAPLNLLISKRHVQAAE